MEIEYLVEINFNVGNISRNFLNIASELLEEKLILMFD